MLSFFMSLAPHLAQAHVKWFVPVADLLAPAPPSFAWYTLRSTPVLVWLGISAVVIALGAWLDRKVTAPESLSRFARRHTRGIARVAEAVLGLFLLMTSALWGVALSPEAQATTALGQVLLWITVLVGVLFVVGVRTRVAAGLLLALVLAVGATHGVVSVLENAILVGLALYVLVTDAPESSRFHGWRSYGLPFVRIGVGVTLVTLAFTEKFLAPGLSMEFLRQHHWNFMQPLFPWFSDQLFILSTGFAETIFGLLFIGGWLTRLTTIVIAVFFATSVTTMLLQAGAWEAEDLVVYAAAILLLAFGSGRLRRQRS